MSLCVEVHVYVQECVHMCNHVGGDQKSTLGITYVSWPIANHVG